MVQGKWSVHPFCCSFSCSCILSCQICCCPCLFLFLYWHSPRQPRWCRGETREACSWWLIDWLKSMVGSYVRMEWCGWNERNNNEQQQRALAGCAKEANLTVNEYRIHELTVKEKRGKLEIFIRNNFSMAVVTVTASFLLCPPDASSTGASFPLDLLMGDSYQDTHSHEMNAPTGQSPVEHIAKFCPNKFQNRIVSRLFRRLHPSFTGNKKQRIPSTESTNDHFRANE